MKDKIKREEFKQMFLTGEWSMKNYTLENYIDELFNHIESIEAENKELKKKLLEVENNDYILDLEFKVSNLEAKLEAIESNKVAEFSGRPHLHEDSYWVLDDQSSEFLLIDYGDDLDSKTHVTVTISKDK